MPLRLDGMVVSTMEQTIRKDSRQVLNEAVHSLKENVKTICKARRLPQPARGIQHRTSAQADALDDICDEGRVGRGEEVRLLVGRIGSLVIALPFLQAQEDLTQESRLDIGGVDQHLLILLLVPQWLSTSK